LIAAITGSRNPAEIVLRLKRDYHDFMKSLDRVKFWGKGQRPIPVANAREAVEITLMLPGKKATEFRKQCATLVCRYLGGDETLVDEMTNHMLTRRATIEPLGVPCITDDSVAPKRCPEDPVEEPERKRARPEDQTLYVISLQIPGIDGVSRFGYKIGRTSDIESRLDGITGSLPRGPLLDLVVHAMFPNAGHLEQALHKRFQYHMVEAKRSREWFRVPLPEILHAIAELKAM
jgi:hypothetical protein